MTNTKSNRPGNMPQRGTKMEVKYAPAGYFPNGQSKPYREVVIIEHIDTKYCRVQYVNTGEITVAVTENLYDKPRY